MAHVANMEYVRKKRHRLPTGTLGISKSHDEKRVYAACIDGVYELDVETGEIEKLFEHQSYASNVILVPGTDLLVSSGYDGIIRWYDLSKRTVVRHLQAHKFWSWSMAGSADGKLLASATGQYLAGSYQYEPAAETEPSVKIFDAATGNVMHELTHVPSVQAVAFSPDGRYVAAGNIMGEIRVWNAISGDLILNWTTPDFTSWGIIKSHCYIGGIFALCFAPHGEHLLAAGMGPMRDPMAGNGRQLWQRFAWMHEPVEKVDETKRDQSGEGLMETLTFNSAGDTFLMGGRLRGGKWNAALFDAVSGNRVQALNTGYRMTDSAFSNDDRFLVTSGCYRQKRPQKGKDSSWGVVDIFELKSSDA